MFPSAYRPVTFNLLSLLALARVGTILYLKRSAGRPQSSTSAHAAHGVAATSGTKFSAAVAAKSRQPQKPGPPVYPGQGQANCQLTLGFPLTAEFR